MTATMVAMIVSAAVVSVVIAGVVRLAVVLMSSGADHLSVVLIAVVALAMGDSRHHLAVVAIGPDSNPLSIAPDCPVVTGAGRVPLQEWIRLVLMRESRGAENRHGEKY